MSVACVVHVTSLARWVSGVGLLTWSCYQDYAYLAGFCSLLVFVWNLYMAVSTVKSIDSKCNICFEKLCYLEMITANLCVLCQIISSFSDPSFEWKYLASNLYSNCYPTPLDGITENIDICQKHCPHKLGTIFYMLDSISLEFALINNLLGY